MTSQTKAFLTLVISAPILTEIVSGNTPAHALLNPRIDLFLLVAYSLPLLVIREVFLRWRLPALGLFLLGLAYGIWNEGLLAQTLIRHEHVPMEQFDGYIYAAGFNFSWAAVIVPWHALLAVAFPMALAGGLFPSCERKRFLGNRTFAALTAILAALILFISVARKPHPQMLVCLFAMSTLVFLAYLLRGSQAAESRSHPRQAIPFLLGALAYPAFIFGAIALASNRVPASAYFAIIFAIFAGLAALGRRYNVNTAPAATGFALGAYFAASLFNMAGGVAHHSLEKVLTGAILAGVFSLLAIAGPAEASPGP
jgi:hypothetical protein